MGVNFVFGWETNAFEMDVGTPKEVSGDDAVKSWAAQMLRIKRGRLEIMPETYGTNAADLIGKRLPRSYQAAEIDREITEACALCPEIKSVDDIKHQFDEISMHIEPVHSESVPAAEVTEEVKPPFIITAQPEDVTVAVNETARFSVAVDGSGMTYQWQYKSATGTEWADTTLVGNKTRTLSVTASAGRNGYMYRCMVTAGTYVVASEAGALTVGGVSAFSLDGGDER